MVLPPPPTPPPPPTHTHTHPFPVRPGVARICQSAPWCCNRFSIPSDVCWRSCTMCFSQSSTAMFDQVHGVIKHSIIQRKPCARSQSCLEQFAHCASAGLREAPSAFYAISSQGLGHSDSCCSRVGERGSRVGELGRFCFDKGHSGSLEHTVSFLW